MYLGKVLPASHLSDSSRDTLKVMTGLMATLAALILGLLIASAKASYDRANDDFRQLAAKTVLLDRALAEYGPETKDVRAYLLNAYKTRMDQLFPTTVEDARPGPLERRPLKVEEIETRLRALLPPSEAKRAHMERALQVLDQMANSGWILTIEESDTALPPLMLVVLIACSPRCLSDSACWHRAMPGRCRPAGRRAVGVCIDSPNRGDEPSARRDDPHLRDTATRRDQVPGSLRRVGAAAFALHRDRRSVAKLPLSCLD